MELPLLPARECRDRDLCRPGTPENSPKSLCTKCLIGGFGLLCGWVLVGWFLCGFWVCFGISCGSSFAFLLHFVLGFGLLWEES